MVLLLFWLTSPPTSSSMSQHPNPMMPALAQGGAARCPGCSPRLPKDLRCGFLNKCAKLNFMSENLPVFLGTKCTFAVDWRMVQTNHKPSALAVN